jgi:CBS domain containing-hemolysin-like protein
MPHETMSAVEIALRIAAGVILILTNAFFVVTEFALTRLRQLPEEEFRDHPGLRRAWKMTEKLEIYLTGCQVGISLSSILLGIVAEPAVTALLHPLFEAVRVPERAIPATSVVVSIVILNLVHKVWGEQAPTYLGVEAPKQVARRTATPHYWWCKATYPLILIGDGMAKWTLKLFGVEMSRSWTEEGTGEDGDDRSSEARPASRAELRREMGDILSRGRVPADRREEVIRALEIDEIPVRDIMVPRDRILAVSTERSIEENLETMRSDHLSRFPLVGESVDDFRGILYLPAVFRAYDALRSGETTLEEIAVEPLVVPAGLPVSRLIDRFQQARQEIALVEEESDGSAEANGGRGRIVGLVTVTEAFEAISGDVEDPYD